MSWYLFLYMNLDKVRITFGGQVWVKYEPLVNWVSSDMHVGQEAMSCNVCPVAIPEICAQTQGSDYWQLIHWCQSTCGPSVALHIWEIGSFYLHIPYENLKPDRAWRRPCSGQITIHRATHRHDMSRTKNLLALNWAKKMLRSIQGLERSDKANRSRARAGQEPDNVEYLYTF